MTNREPNYRLQALAIVGVRGAQTEDYVFAAAELRGLDSEKLDHAIAELVREGILESVRVFEYPGLIRAR